MYILFNLVLVLMIIGLTGLLGLMGMFGYYMLRNRVPYVVLPQGAMTLVAQHMGVTVADTVYDLGCGDGRVIGRLQTDCPGARYIGVENDPAVWLLARFKLKKSAKLIRAGIMDTPLTAATRIYVYLGPQLMAQLEPRFERELAPGARVVSVQFPLPNRKPDSVVELKDSANYAARLFVYNY
jgi:trans-aconitate methyltransferase